MNEMVAGTRSAFPGHIGFGRTKNVTIPQHKQQAWGQILREFNIRFKPYVKLA